MRLSGVQIEALEWAVSAGRLVRVIGGFWTVPKLATEIPSWYCGVQTVRALEARGLLVRGSAGPEWCYDRIPSEGAKDALHRALNPAEGAKGRRGA